MNEALQRRASMHCEDGFPGLAGSAAVVWGGGSGMGLSTARRLARSGCRVACVDLDAALAQQAAATLVDEGAEAIGIGANVTDEADVENALAAASDRFGVITRSASVVGRASWKSAIDMTVADWELDQKLNLRPMFLIGRTMARHLRDAGKPGSIAFVSSVSGMQAAIDHCSYGAAKRAQQGLVQTLAFEWGALGIRVNLVSPGPIATARMPASAELDAIVDRRVPVGRLGTVEEMAACLAFLLSDVSTFVNGENIVADGGWLGTPAIMPSDNPVVNAAKS